MQEIHLFILWENALYKKQEILKDMQESFDILGMYNITWSKEKFSENLSRFYGTNLPKGCGKEEHCGNGTFLLVVVRCNNPKYEDRDTSKGIQRVNTSMFDKKTYYRELTGGGHRVHATNSEIETNHDLTLLLGKSIKDFVKENNSWDGNEINLQKDLFGANGWSDAKEMFYALNNCINYALLRNYETLPEEIYVNEHNDIDIICDSFENAAYVLNAKKVFNEEYRVHYKAMVGQGFANFDLRYIGDAYYFKQLEEDLLKTKIYNEKGFYTISNDYYFYTLLYHALLHKPSFSEDYKNRLSKMNKEFENLENEQQYLEMLQKWLIQNEYIVIKPIDKSVQFNKENAKRLSPLVYKDNSSMEEAIIQNEELKNENKRLREELVNVYNSKSWKITEVLRKISKKIKNRD